jgi:glycosyltransferase involved in cell wall biosynthesis
MSNAKALCLNMIVKNEMANLERCLSAVADHIACWIISDTGSTDGTQDFIRSFFAARNIPGELHSFPFHNFEQARNAALDCAYASQLAYDYLLFDDADMELVVEDRDFRTKLTAPSYTVLQRANISYWNTRLVRRDAGARYRGVTHEYVDVPGGGREQLHGIWYKDHASGSNRVDKFERDVRLLTEALEKEPDSSRYWFYLAQSYRDAGQTAKAAEIYAKRAEMGGWDEEAWYARLQKARCLRTLGDEGGFLREALAALHQRPQRAEPLYDLARYFREHGKNDVSVLFSEPGLAIKKPDDVLFIEDFVYTTGLKEEYSIAAYYTRDPARQDRGFATCDWLALNRTIPDQARDLARRNTSYYLKPASALMPSFAARRIEFTPPDGYHLSNPSVARLGDDTVLLQRAVNFTLSENGEYRTPNGVPFRTRNFLLKLDVGLSVQSSSEILPPADMPAPAFPPVQGFEDARLFAWRDELWCIACVRELTPEGWCEQVLARIDDSLPGSCKLTDWRVLRPQGPRQHERNWIPRIVGNSLQYIQSCDPIRFVDENARPLAETVPPIAADRFRGSTQAIMFDGGWLALVHEVSERDKQRFHQHRFVWLDMENRLRRLSRPFFFIKNGVELACGLAHDHDGKGLLISFGVNDNEAWVAGVEAGDVRRSLEDAARLPCGTLVTDPALSPVLYRKPDSDGFKFSSSSEASSSNQSTAQPSTSTWIPQTASAGTELMVAGLKQRLGQELELINLQVNHPGHDNADPRPRVVWMHHDVDQRWVQWCREKDLVDSVNCFVFVSDWQRQRYIETFALPPQRCVVLRHAVDISPEVRRWEQGHVLRCAYTSTPFRGLSVLLDAWELVNPANAELHIWSSMKLYMGDDSPYEHLYTRARSLRGVIYRGLAPNAELRAALRDMHFLTYPSTFAETACLAAIEALAAGCRLIVPSLGALPETAAGYARIYPMPASVDEHVTKFAENLAAELATPWAGNPDASFRQQAYCAAVYNWPRCLRAWRQLIRRLCDQTKRSEAA